MALHQPLLELLTAANVVKIWDNNGTRAKYGTSVWQAREDAIPEGAYMVGQVAVPAQVGAIPPSSVTLVKPLVESDAYGKLIMRPRGYHFVWNDKGLGGIEGCSFWRVLPPPGYEALGDVACKGYYEPSKGFTAKYACIRKDLLRGGVVDPSPVWKDVGSGASLDFSIWNVIGNGIGGFYKAQEGYTKPSYDVFVLCGGPFWAHL